MVVEGRASVVATSRRSLAGLDAERVVLDVVFIRGPKTASDPAAVVSIEYSDGGTHGIVKDLRQYLTA